MDILAKNCADKSKLQKLQDKYKKKQDKVYHSNYFSPFPHPRPSSTYTGFFVFNSCLSCKLVPWGSQSLAGDREERIRAWEEMAVGDVIYNFPPP